MATLLNLSAVITPVVIRLQLGVDNLDITDEQVVESGLYDELNLDFYGWFPRYGELFNSLETSVEVLMQQVALKTYGKLFMCRKLALSGRLGFAQKVKDGENQDDRFSINWDKAIMSWETEMAEAKNTVLGIDTQYLPEDGQARPVGASILAISSPNTDVVDQ